MCPGDDVSIACSTNGDFLRWNLTVIVDELGGTLSRDRLVSSSQGLEADRLELNEMVFYIRSIRNISNGMGSVRLNSTISAANSTANLNGTTVKCTEVYMSSQAIVSVTVVHILRADNGMYILL